MEVMTFNIDKDRRNLVDDKQNFSIDFHDSKYNWLQARQYEESMRQVEVHVVRGDGSPVDLTGINPMFEGWLSEGLYRIIDAKHSVMIDAKNGIFRFDFPAPAFQIAGSYKQAFFRLMKDGMSVTTLEFSLDVMADKVISGLVPSDYITPFEDLYGKLKEYLVKFNGDFDAAMAQWKKDVADLITELNADVSGINLTITEIQTQLASLEDKIKADNLATQADLDAFIKQISDMLFDVVNVDEGVDIGEALPNNLKKQLDDFKAKLPEDQFKIAIISDSHYEDRYRNTIWGSYPYTKDAYKHLTAFNYLQDAVDVMIANGDHVNGLDASVENTKQELSAYNEKLLTGVNTDRYALVGNHDDGSPSKSYNKTITPVEIISNDELEKLFHTHDLINGEVRNNGSMYFYKDYDEAKIRLVGLYTEDIPENAVNADGTPKFTRWLYHTYGQAQLDWLAKAAFSNIPADYQVVVVGHAPLYYGWTDEGAHQYNFELLKGLLDAVDVGNSFSGISTAEVPTEMKVSVNADYSEQGPRPVAAFIAGHVHKELTVPLDRFTMTTVLNDANTDSTVESDSTQSMAFTVYCFDKAKRKVSMYGFGRATDRKYDY
ncbi:BppU family phage baseplate upper protein [Pediococcus pentosaceus]|uniref:BppU family phage baseplate upper protein n=1 Tax=Pediococcus pentosaceus TaxID=1255 RepID=UPI003D77E7FB